ncbi:MAG: phosphoribosylglycinamide formyltransferase [Deltaproteobacteria bacterium]|nr:phosphoribosylglycinamide formyltransferase [Deltaproteobacteria bacterium]
MLKLGVLISGGGTNLQAIIDEIEAKRLDAKISLVISSKPDAGGLERAKKHGIKTLVITKADHPEREAYDKAIVAALKDAGAELVVLAGFMRIVTPTLINAFKNKIINIHPALLPAFPGLDVQQKAIDYGARFSGATVHFVDEGVDTGPVILQAVVPVLQNDTAKTLAARILNEEHKILPEAIRLISEGRVSVQGRRVIIKDAAENDTPLTNPKTR